VVMLREECLEELCACGGDVLKLVNENQLVRRLPLPTAYPVGRLEDEILEIETSLLIEVPRVLLERSPADRKEGAIARRAPLIAPRTGSGSASSGR
jgi:hypothetical protein